MRWVVFTAFVMISVAVAADDLQQAQELAWAKQFEESEALYRRVLTGEPRSIEARLGLARVVLWQGRYGEALELFAALDGIEALEGRATAHYWSGDLRAAARDFRRVLELDANRELARRSLAEIASTAGPSQRVSVATVRDDQPLQSVRSEVEASVFSDPQTRWTASIGHYAIDAGGWSRGESVSLANETTIRSVTVAGRLGLFRFPDGVRRPAGSASVRRGALALRIERRPELASAPSLDRHVASTTTALRWSRDRDWIGSVEVSDIRYSDDNRGYAAAAYVVVPARWGGWTLWYGASAAMRDTEQSRFDAEGRYDPYWTPDDLREVRAVLAVERSLPRGSVKMYADAGRAHDRARAFDVPFARTYDPWGAGVSAEFRLTAGLRMELLAERRITVDYRVTSFHASLVRRR